MASAVLYLRTNSCNPAYTGVPYRGIGKYSNCLLLLFLRCCTSPHLLRHPGIRHTVPVHEIPPGNSVHRILFGLADNHRGRLERAYHYRLYITTYRMSAPRCVLSRAKPDMLSHLHALDHALEVLHAAGHRSDRNILCI